MLVATLLIACGHQPTLDNPLLKNHKIQAKKSAAVNEPYLQAGFKEADCPEGTVPIHRTTKEELTRAKTLSHQIFANISKINLIAPNVHVIFGSGAIFKPNMAQDQSSSVNVWVDSGPPDYVTRLIAGSLVSTSINGDDSPRVFIYWTLDADKTGCLDSLCQGFVQIDRNVGPKTRFEQMSSFGGATYDAKFDIYQDYITKNWWLVMTDKNISVGYWPRELVPSLENGAGDVGWGGIAMAPENEDVPPMGSGQYPDGTYTHVGYFQNLHFMKGWMKPRAPRDDDPVWEYPGELSCCGLQNDKDTRDNFWGYRFGFGGPGGCG
ncbi:hypothetical protein D8674_004120 [Pyrus ussuriensis x Pyrus communis]|uniref:Neprosin PEP catalytic domain-containing protein n=1 Tax=Pyrus ussuriensis x Pyrus communis TaxID=2448454 RepID=A0A5N5FJ01_9ROSA|nr:hypothetical protein D8674_004120 [Pyrus ussuriensis x Pyrus communis]